VPGVPIAVHMCALMINIALGARIVNTAHVESLPACLSVTLLPLLLLGGQYEEPGWMGYAQRHRQERFAESVLCLSHSRCRHHPNDLAYAVAGLWHHPPGSAASSGHSRCKSFAPGSMTWLAMIAHLFSNVMAATMKPLFNPADQERYWLILVVVECLTALGVIIATRGRLGLKPPNERGAARSSPQ